MIRIPRWALAGAVAMAAYPAFADQLPPLLPNEALAIQPDGRISRIILSDPAALADLMKVAKRIPWCKMLVMGSDGKVYLVNTDGHNPMVACEEMADR